MSEFPAPLTTECTSLPIVLDGELTEHFDAPNLLEAEPVGAAEPAASTFTSQGPEKPSLRDRFFRSRLGRLALGGLTALGLAAGGVAVEASPAVASSNPVYTVTNYDNDGTHGIYYRNSPRMADSLRQLPYYAAYGDRIELICGTNGEAVGAKQNKRWHLVKDLDNPKAPGQFYIPDHDTNTPNGPNERTVGERECGDTSPNLGNQTVNPQQAETVPPFVNYDRHTAISWALSHAKDIPPNSGSCTWFVSLALVKGGFPQTDTWNAFYQGVERWDIRYGTDATKKTPDFLAYMDRLTYVDVIPLGQLKTGINNIPQARLGDIIIYDWENDNGPDHADIITGFAKNNSQYPLVSGWSEDGGRALTYSQRGWTWSKKNDDWLTAHEPEAKAWLIHIRTQDDVGVN